MFMYVRISEAQLGLGYDSVVCMEVVCVSVCVGGCVGVGGGVGGCVDTHHFICILPLEPMVSNSV